jgi:hypothetical protein
VQVTNKIRQLLYAKTPIAVADAALSHLFLPLQFVNIGRCHMM